MLLLIDHSTKSYAFYQVDRNTIVDVPVMNAQGDFDDYFPEQICLAHWYGYDDDTRNENLVNAAFDVFGGLDLDKYYVMGMEDIDTINDAIGGVTVTIDSDLTKIDPAFKDGATVHLDGAQAEKYLRARMGLDDATNAARMKRQRQYMDNAYTMIISQLRENPEYINDLYDSLKDVFQTNGQGKDISRITNCIVNYDNKGTITFDGKTELNDTIGEGIEHEEFYLDYDSVYRGLSQVMNLEEDTEAEEDSEEETEDIEDTEDTDA
jgi:anionic cell wall polymer biosynthesis LytR-Cps2A-Psr (LCP) family protein